MQDGIWGAQPATGGAKAEAEAVPATLEEYIFNHQSRWSAIIAALNERTKKITDVVELQNMIYVKRQDALDYYYSLLFTISSRARQFKKAYAARYAAYKTGYSSDPDIKISPIKFSTEAAIKSQVESDLSDSIYWNEVMENHAKYMLDTIKTIDGLIYAIRDRIKLEEYVNLQ